VAVLAGSGLLAWLDDVGVPVEMSNWLWWHGQSIMPLATLLTVQPMWVHTALNALNWPADGWVTTKSPDALITPPPTGTSAVLTGVPLGAAAEAEAVADALAEAADEVEDADEVVDADVVVEGAVVVGVVEPPHAARAAAPATPAPPTPAARRTVRRFMAVSPPVASLGVLLVVVSGCADMASSCL
jgi:hypothetical protein